MLKTTTTTTDDIQTLSELARALSSPQRLEILNALNDNSLSISELSKLLQQPMSTATTNVDILEQVGLITTKMQYTKKGKVRLCSRSCDAIYIGVHRNTVQELNQLNIDLPIGSYVGDNIVPSCGLATKTHTIGKDDDPDNFFLPERFEAKLIWFTSGYVEYRISKANIPEQMKELEISFEACSEAPFYRNNWKSDITVWLNDIEIGTWTCPSDFGGRKGMLNPEWWPDSMTQYGMLTYWKITRDGSYFNNDQISLNTLNDYKIKESPYLSIKIGVKSDAHYKGGINLFGSSFGDYEQDIAVRAKW